MINSHREINGQNNGEDPVFKTKFTHEPNDTASDACQKKVCHRSGKPAQHKKQAGMRKLTDVNIYFLWPTKTGHQKADHSTNIQMKQRVEMKAFFAIRTCISQQDRHKGLAFCVYCDGNQHRNTKRDHIIYGQVRKVKDVWDE